MKHKSTKSALLMSFTSLILCFAMLIGTTFAWFTDSVTSGVNKIQAGNLDIDVSYKDGDNWVSIEGADSLFDKTALWEPGHTEYVTLKIENKGNLALKYQMKVSPVSESGGVNVSGQSFKLSDYLMFGVTDAAATPPTYDRTTARAAVNAATKLNAITKTGTMAANAGAQYITLVVYMPETVGNEANYKTGTAAPFINLGITVLATQVENEKDSFDENYDKDLTNDASVVYNYFPQVTQVAQLKKSASASTAEPGGDGDPQVTAANDKITITSAAKVGEGTDAPVAASVTFGNNAVNFGSGDTATVTLNVKKTEASAANITAETDALQAGTREKVSYDVNVAITGADDVAFANDALLEVKMFVGQHKTNLKLYHVTAEMHDDGTTLGTQADHFVYNAATGFVTMNVNHFSDFFAIYDSPVAAIGTTAYYSLESAVAAAQAGETVVLLKDIDAEAVAYGQAGFTAGVAANDVNAITINGNGHKITSAANYALVLDNTTAAVTVKNLTVAGTGDVNKSAINLTGCSGVVLENVKASGTKTGVIVNNSVATIKGANTDIAQGAWHAVNVDNGGTYNEQSPALTVEGGKVGLIYCEGAGSANISGGNIAAVAGAPNGFTGKITVTGGTFSVNPAAYVAAPYYVNGETAPFTIAKCTEHQYDNDEDADCGTCGFVRILAPKPTIYVKADGSTVVEGKTTYKTLEDAINAANSNDVIGLWDEEVVYSTYGTTYAQNKTLTFVGLGADKTTWNICFDQAVNGEGGSDYSFEGSTVSFYNLKIHDKVANGDHRGFVRAKNLSFNFCTFDARESYWGVGNVNFESCTFEDTGDWNMWAYSGKVFNFNNCTFKSSMKGNVNVYQESGSNNCELTFTGCNFILESGKTTDKPVVQAGEDHNDTNRYSITFNDCKITGNYANGSFDSHPKYVLNKNNKSTNTLSVSIDGTKVY